MNIFEEIKTQANRAFTDFLYPGTTARAEQLTQEHIDLVNRRLVLGLDTPEEAQTAINRIRLNGDAIVNYQIPELAPTNGFVEGLKEGRDNITDAARNTITATFQEGFKTAWQIIPAWLWVLVGFGVILYLAPLLTAIIGATSKK